MRMILSEPPGEDFYFKRSEEVPEGNPAGWLIYTVPPESFDCDGWFMLTGMLARNEFSITALDLSDDSLGGIDSSSSDRKEVKELAYALITNTTLLKLNLSDHMIEDRGALALANALETNNTLKILDLGENFISVGGAKCLAEALKINRALIKLNLQGNDLNCLAGDTILADIDIFCLRNRRNPIACANILRKAEPIEVPKLSTQLVYYIALQSNRYSSWHQNVLNQKLDQDSLDQIKRQKKAFWY